MAKKAPKKKKTVNPPNPKEAYLLKLIEISEQNVTSLGSSLDELFTNQAARLRKELEALRGK